MHKFEPVQYGKYYLLDKIATGGMAELFRAKQTGAEGFEKLIAIKKILQHLNTEEKLVSSFIDEAKLAAYLQHPNIVQIYDFGSQEDTYYIAMEYLFGKDLRFVMKKAGLKDMAIDVGSALFIISQLCAGLDYAHTLNDFSGKPLNIIHRDIGPQNLFVTYNGLVKIIDFGIAKAATQNTNTQVGTIKGKVAYMSPEQAGGEIIDHRSDIFSVGIVLYELLTHRKMYEGDTFQVLAKAREAIFEPPEKLNSSLPADVIAIVNKSLQKNPDLRYQTAEEMGRDIELYMQNNSLMNSQRDLAAYMKELFKEEVEDSDFRSIVSGESVRGIPSSKPEASEKSSDQTLEDTVVTEETQAISKWRWKRVFFYSLSLGSLIAFLLFYYTDLKKYIPDVSLKKLIDRTVSEAPVVPVVSQEDIDAGRTLVENKQYSKAVKYYESLINKNPDIKESISDAYSEALTGVGSTLMRKRPKDAERLLLKATRLNPENSTGLFLLGRVYTSMKKNKKAVDYYTRASELEPDNPDIFFNLGYSFAIQYDYGKATEMYEKVIALSPPFIDEALFNLALIQEKTGARNLAIENLEKAISLNPRNINAVRFLKKLRR